MLFSMFLNHFYYKLLLIKLLHIFYLILNIVNLLLACELLAEVIVNRWSGRFAHV